MKKLFFGFLATVLFSVSLLANNPTIKKFKISNYELLNVETENYLFKKNNCENGGFSFFSPFETNPELLETTAFTKIVDNEVELNITNSVFTKKYTFSNFRLEPNGNLVTFDIAIGNYIYKSSVEGINLTVDYVKDFLVKINNINLSKVCPPCAYVAIVAVAAAVTNICTNASAACSPCNGKLEVGACSCSCTPAK